MKGPPDSGAGQVGEGDSTPRKMKRKEKAERRGFGEMV